jgi:hypothetical protein
MGKKDFFRRATIYFLCAALLSCSESAREEHPERLRESGTTFDEFIKTVYQEKGTGIFIVDGDFPIERWTS